MEGSDSTAGRGGRGRGRGMMMAGSCEGERTDLRRPLVSPQDIVTIPQQQPQNNLVANNAYNDAQFYGAQAAQAKQVQDNIQMHLQQQQQQFQQIRQTHQQQSAQQQINLAAAAQQQHSSQIHLMFQQQQQQQQQINVHQQQVAQMSLPQQVFPLGNIQPQQQQQQQQPHNTTSSSIGYLTPQKQQEYEDLKRRSAELEIQRSPFSQQQQQQQQQQQHFQQLYVRNNQAQGLEIEQKLAALQIQSPNIFIHQQMRQQQLQQQQQQQQQHHEILQKQQLEHNQILHQKLLASVGAKSTKLSVDAVEFVPRFDAANSGSSDGQQQQAHMAALTAPQIATQETMNLIPIQPEYASHPVVVQVDTAVVQLTGNPTKYDSICRTLTSVLSWQVKEENLMREVVTVIFEQGVGEADFRYAGGKLCEHLVKNLAQQYNGPSFKSLLLQRCQEEFEHRHEFLALGIFERLIGYSFFLAEVLTRLLTPTGQPIIKLREALCEMLLILLDVTTNDSLKCVAQVLKLSGKYLEMGCKYSASSTMNGSSSAQPASTTTTSTTPPTTPSSSSSSNNNNNNTNNSVQVEDVMSKLRDVAMTPITPNMKTLLMSVVELRASNWGCRPEDDEKAGGDHGPAVNGGDSLPVLGTIYYGPQGEIHHIEEDCLEDCASDSDDTNTAKQHGPPPLYVELDGDEKDAFEDFLKSVEQQQQQRQ